MRIGLLLGLLLSACAFQPSFRAPISESVVIFRPPQGCIQGRYNLSYLRRGTGYLLGELRKNETPLATGRDGDYLAPLLRATADDPQAHAEAQSALRQQRASFAWTLAGSLVAGGLMAAAISTLAIEVNTDPMQLQPALVVVPILSMGAGLASLLTGLLVSGNLDSGVRLSFYRAIKLYNEHAEVSGCPTAPP